MIRRLKFAYMLYNMFHKKELMHNVPLYKKLGLKKSYFSPISNEDFKHVDPNKLTDSKRIHHLESLELYKKIDTLSQESVNNFQENGYCVIHKYLSNEIVDKINLTIESMVEEGALEFQYRNKLMFAIHKSEFLNKLWNEQALVDLLSHLINGQAKLFQSINFFMGSQQKTHSDSIHMTTFPLGGLLGVWLALEDIELDNGPLHYYPKSHKLPYYLNKDYDNLGSKILLGPHDYTEYEKMLSEKVKEQGIEKQVFQAKKGDLFIWHANLLHGGEPHLNQNKTRKSMVLHYFDINRICYHEISQRPALMGRAI